MVLEAWYLELHWRLVLGAWGFRLSGGRSHLVAPCQTRKHESGGPQKLTKVTKEVNSILCFLRLLGVRKYLRFESEPVKASRTWSNRIQPRGDKLSPPRNRRP